MYVSNGIEPSELIWPNLNITGKAKLLYTLLFWVVYIAFLTLSVFVFILLESNKENIENNLPELNCEVQKLSIIDASLDHMREAS